MKHSSESGTDDVGNKGKRFIYSELNQIGPDCIIVEGGCSVCCKEFFDKWQLMEAQTTRKKAVNNLFAKSWANENSIAFELADLESSEAKKIFSDNIGNVFDDEIICNQQIFPPREKTISEVVKKHFDNGKKTIALFVGAKHGDNMKILLDNVAEIITKEDPALGAEYTSSN